MNKYSLAFSFLFISCFIIIFSSCKKINEATELGNELIPAIDNINTFDTVLNVETYNGIFTDAEDSARSIRTDIHFVGNINQDPLFGKTEASMFFQLKPGTFKYNFPFSKDSLISLDSVVLVLGYKNTYGDTTSPQQVAVYEIPTSNSFRSDSSYFIRKNQFTTLGSALGPAKTFIPQNLNDSVFPYNERAANQLRIPLDKSFGQRLLNYDTTNAYASDSAFKTFFNGFAVVPQNNGAANALVGFNLADTNTKLSFYVRYTKNGNPNTSVVNFKLTSTSAAANYINRNYAGSQLASYQNTTPTDLLFIQNTPGTYATIKVPGLNSVSNRIVHRAELIVEQVADPSDKTFPPPTYLYLDAFDSSKSKFRTIPFDFTVTSSSGQYNAQAFGMIGKPSTDAAGNVINIWKFDVSRYIQHVVNKTEPAYNFRLSAPYVVKEIYRNGTSDVEETLPLINPVYAAGRVRVGGGNHPTQRMRLRIIYSKL